MSEERLFRLIAELIEVGVFDITLAGGEPLLYPNIEDVLSLFVKEEINIGILTNAVQITDSFLSKINNQEYKRCLSFQISIDSNEPDINDRTRGRTCEVLDNIFRLSKMGFLMQTSTVLTKANYKTATHIIDFLYPHVKRFQFLNMQATKESLKYPELFLTKEETKEFWLELAERIGSYPPDIKIPSLGQFIADFESLDPNYSFNSKATFNPPSCSAGHHTINVDASFNVLGCDIAKNETVMGNLNDSSLKDIWNSERANTIRRLAIPPCLLRDDNGDTMDGMLNFLSCRT
jgi:MoaA/NifB/PqqE/SkfB family radical SAM enzyme